MGAGAHTRTHLGEVALAVADQETGLAAAAIADNDQLLGPCWRLGDIGADGAAAAAGGQVGADSAIAIPMALGAVGATRGGNGGGGQLLRVLATEVVVVLGGLDRHGGV